MEQERVYQLTYPYGGVGQNAFALRPDTIWVGSNNGVLVFCDGAFRWLNNDEAGISDASSPQNPQSATFDLQGRRIQGEPQHGVYIKEGKKVMK